MNVFEMKCLRPKVGVTRWDRIRNEEIRRRAGIEETLSEKVDKKSIMMVWAHGRDERGALAKEGQSSYSGKSTGHWKA